MRFPHQASLVVGLCYEAAEDIVRSAIDTLLCRV